MLAVLVALLLYLFIPVGEVFAVCPVCTVAIGAGVGLSRYLGIDDTVTGLWIGGFVISSSLWFSNWLEKKNIRFPLRSTIAIVIFYASTIIPLIAMKIIGHKGNKLWGVDKLVLGMAIGSLLFLLSVLVDRMIRKRNGGKVLFYYQRVILPVSLLAISSTAFYIITKI